MSVKPLHRNNVDQWCRGERNPPAIAMMVFMAERGLLDVWKTHQQPLECGKRF
ncbi:hypothetical protein ACR71G_01985 [Xenorhabdus bovienii]|uniref:hypothetical protein n=1 Tax=Xenorhabdus bovienii TaxID=40576 RepID=UPI003DA25C57